MPIATRQPSPTSPTTRSAAVRASSKKTSLNSEVPVSWTDRADLDARLVHRHQQVGQALVALRARLGAGDDEAPVGRCASDVHTFWPLITPLVAVEARRGGDGGEVGAGAGLGVALAPQLLDAVDARAGSGASAPRVPNAISVGPSSSSPRWLTRAGAPARAYSSWKMTCWLSVALAAAVLLGPAEAGPAGGGEVAVPGQPLLEGLVLTAGAARAAQRGELAGEVVGQPLANGGGGTGRRLWLRPAPGLHPHR